ncbi:MAG: hypothetical protein IJY39_01530 [Clostridia bacterium]|nr:hypothetical protein [Clostridia bacterium]
MENNNVFVYRYSAAQNQEIQKIRDKYLPREESKAERLKRLDRRVQSAGFIEALSIGVIGCLIFGIGICFGLNVLNGADWLAVLLCSVGAAVMIPAYPTYRRISRKTRERLIPEILRLSDEIINS